MTQPPAPYPPPRHLLRDLQFSFDHAADGTTSRAWMPVVEELCTTEGQARAGVLATLVDVIGGGLAASAAHPNWIATADLTLHLYAGASPGSTVEARASVLRAGRTTVVIEVDLVDVGLATMSFTVLPRRDVNPDVRDVRNDGPSSMALPDSRLRQPLLDAIGVNVIDEPAGVIEAPVSDWARNSMGAMQGGVVATLADFAAEVALRAATGRPVVVRDLALTYLGFGRAGPVRTRTDVLNDEIAHVEIVDANADHRLMTTASAVAT